MLLTEVIKPNKGVTAVIGSGGKTSLIRALAYELASGSKVLICSDHAMPATGFEHISGRGDIASAARALTAAAAVGMPAVIGELKDGVIRPVKTNIDAAAGYADYLFLEVDDSRGLPLTAHFSGQPVLPRCTRSVIEVIGLSGLCRPVRMAANNAERYAELAGIDINDFVSPEAAARVINREALQELLFVNMADSKEWYEEARLLCGLVRSHSVIGSLKSPPYSIYM